MSNALTVSGTIASPSTPSSADVCVVTGYLINIHGQVLRGVACDVQNLYYPLALGSDTLVLRQHNQVLSDSDGKIEFEALQGARIRFTVPNLHGDVLFEGNVPAASACDLLDIVLPYVVSIAWDDASISADVGSTFSARLTGTLTDGTTCDVTAAVTTTVADTDVAAATSAVGTYDALTVGATTISADSFDADSLAISQATDETVIYRLSIPAATLPSPLAITVS